MKKLSHLALGLALTLCIGIGVSMSPVHAATPNYSSAISGVTMIPLHISGQYTATTTAVTRFAMPFPCKLIGVGASARASGGTSPTLTVSVKEGASSVLSSAISVTAGAYSEGTISDTAIADESAITVDLTIGGTSPTWNDITVLLICVRM